jgi:hypothetical protein
MKKVAFEFFAFKSLDLPNFNRTIWLKIFSQILKVLEKNMLITEKVNKINFICPLFPNFDQATVC